MAGSRQLLKEQLDKINDEKMQLQQERQRSLEALERIGRSGQPSKERIKEAMP